MPGGIPIEKLENRRLLSVGASVLSGPLTTGFSNSYSSASGSNTFDYTLRVNGPASFEGNSAVEVEDIPSAPHPGFDLKLLTYENMDSSKGFEIFGSVIKSTNLKTGVTRTDTTTNSPVEIAAPPILTAKVTYHSSWVENSKAVTSDGNPPQLDSTSVQFSIMLVSDTPQFITVPAGKFLAYEFSTVEVDNYGPNTTPSSDTTTSTIWAEAGVGLIKDVAFDTSSSTTDTIVLVKNTAQNNGRLGFGVQPSDVKTNTAIAPAPTVMVENSAGTTITNSTAKVTLAILSGPSGGTLGGTTSVNAVSGIATFNNLTFSVPGTYSLVATAPSSNAGNSNTFVVSAPSAATKLGFISQPVTAAVGATLSPAVAVGVQSPTGATVTANTSNVTLAIATGPAGATLSGTLTVAAVKGVASFGNLQFTVPGTYTLKATDGTLSAAFSKTITVTVGAAAKVVFGIQPSTGIAGSTLSPAITALVEDKFGNIVTSNTSTITLSLATNPVGGTLAGTIAVKAVKGVATFGGLSMKIAGAYTLKASDGALTAGFSKPITIAAGAPAKLVIGTSPATAIAGAAFSPAITVKVEDAFGNIVTGNTSTVALAIGSGPNGGLLGGTLTAKAVKGIATFTGLSIKLAGVYTLKASDGALTPAISAPLTIFAAAAAKLVIVQQPITATAGGQLKPQIVVDVEDAFGNIVTGNTSTVTIASSSTPAATLAGALTAKAVKGVATFTNLSIQKAGTYSLKVIDGLLTAAISKSIVVK